MSVNNKAELIEILNDFEAALKEKPVYFKYSVYLGFVRKHRKLESEIFAYYVAHRVAHRVAYSHD